MDGNLKILDPEEMVKINSAVGIGLLDKESNLNWIQKIGLKWGRFLLAWLGIGAMAESVSVCPFCGQPHCATGIFGASMIGLLGAAFFQWLRNRFNRNKESDVAVPEEDK